MRFLYFHILLVSYFKFFHLSMRVHIFNILILTLYREISISYLKFLTNFRCKDIFHNNLFLVIDRRM